MSLLQATTRSDDTPVLVAFAIVQRSQRSHTVRLHSSLSRAAAKKRAAKKMKLAACNTLDPFDRLHDFLEGFKRPLHAASRRGAARIKHRHNNLRDERHLPHLGPRAPAVVVRRRRSHFHD